MATPTGQVSLWQTRIMMQPETTSGAEAKPNSSRAQQGSDDDIASGLQLTVDLHADSIAKTVEDQGLLSLREAELPGCACVLERIQRTRARSSVMARR